MGDSFIEKGIITYIYLKNFVTYSEVTVKPGRYLNVIVGPNGTGKSTIVCAIVLGLGGKLSTIGRATQIGHYVKYGCNEATIEIHLKSQGRADTVIQRTFNAQGKSVWLLDKKSSNVKEIQELTRNLGIQIDNLCQFLPQDKVQDFSKMNPQELLRNTEKSVGDPMILEHHEKLIQSREDHKDLEKFIEVKKKALEMQTQVYESLKETVSGIKEKKLIKKKILALKQKKAWILYEQKRKELLKLKKKKDAAVSELRRMDEAMKPFQAVMEKLKSEVDQLANSISNHDNKLKAEAGKLKSMLNDLADCDRRITDRENLCKRRIQTEETRDQDIKVEEQSKKKLENDLSLMLEDTGPEETLTAKQQELLSKIEDKSGTITALARKLAMLKQQEQRMNFEIEAQQSEQQRLSVEAKRLQLLRERSSDTYKAVHWLRENRDKFRSTVHEPMLLNLNVKDVKYAKYFENVLSNRDLIAFVCEDKQDMKNLLIYLREQQKLQVNVLYSDPAQHLSTEPKIPLQQIQQYGFTHYLASLIEAPSIVMKYLVRMYNLSNIPIGTAMVDENMNNVPSSLVLYFSQNNSYHVKRSKYSGERCVTTNLVSGTGILSAVLDRSKLLQLEESLNRLREKKAEVVNEIRKVNEEMDKQTGELDEYKTKRNRYKQALQQMQVLKSRISLTERKIADLQNERTSIDEIKRASKEDIKLILEKQMKIYKRYNAVMKECFEYTTAIKRTEISLKMNKRSLRARASSLEEMRSKFKAAEDNARQLSLEAQPMKHEAERLYKEALEITNNISPSDKQFEAVNKVFSKLPPTIEEINKELNIAQAKVFCLGNNVDGENILQQYEEVERNIRHLKDLIQNKTNEYATSTEEIATIQEQWFTALSATVEKINSNFGMYFSAMDCAGEVTLAVPENNLDFDRYGLKIMVKFRDTDKLQELTRHHQSGGERAVTTAIYMISLQELSRVPFRCVDEINQGMDATNERRVFNLLVKMTGRPNSPQYFLLTPKLLQNLEYSETVTVHCVYNGPFMISHEAFDTEQYCQRRIRMREMETEDD